MTTDLLNAVLPISMENVEKSCTWRDASEEERAEFFKAVVTYSIAVKTVAQEHRDKLTLEDELIACTLLDWESDLLMPAITSFDDEIAVNYDSSISEFSDRLLTECQHPQKWVEKLEKAYEENEDDIKERATDPATGKIELGLVGDFSADYRDYLYE